MWLMAKLNIEILIIVCLTSIKKIIISEMKGDLGMSRHEKEGDQEEPMDTETGNH